MSKVSEIIAAKGHQVWSVGPETSVYDAIHIMAEKEIGALMVIENDRLVGIFSERDYARQVILKGRSSRETAIKTIMTSKVITARPDQNVDDCMAMMTENNIRHLPVVQDEVVRGMVSVGDILKTIIAEQQETIDQLGRYISG